MENEISSKRNKTKLNCLFPFFFKSNRIGSIFKQPIDRLFSKRNKISQSQSATVESKSIDDFPDDILTHVISFLPIKDAFRTTVLSKRWHLLCHLLSDIDINDKGVKCAEDLIQFSHMMNAVMFSARSQDRILKSFKLRCCSSLWEAMADCVTIDKWLEAAKRRRVECLNLSLFKIPSAPTIFCCKTLVVLILSRACIPSLFHSSVDLPLLKTLILMAVSFHDTVYFMKLLSGCPKLERLSTFLEEPCVANAGGPAEGCIKPLSKLIMAHICLFEVPFRAVYNVQILQVVGMGKILDNEEINSYYKGLPVFGNLTDLRLYWTCEICEIHDWDEVMKMLHNCPKLQALKIKKDRQSTSSTKADWKYPYHVPECVTSRLTTCRIEDYEAFEADF